RGRQQPRVPAHPFPSLPAAGGLRSDIFNSVISAVFLLIVCLCAVIIKTNEVTLAGGVSRKILMNFDS
uniref:Uncharacterized protein n=1 Tax=Cairina moschata TaxID=8855 RepID=A0A8C3BBQ5_CAIMO